MTFLNFFHATSHRILLRCVARAVDTSKGSVEVVSSVTSCMWKYISGPMFSPYSGMVTKVPLYSKPSLAESWSLLRAGKRH